jgi:aminoglycoside 6'-N-acetyltransferase
VNAPPRLVGELCVLRALGPGDVERLVEIQSEPGIARWWHPPDPAEVRARAQGLEAGIVALGIERDGQPIGLVEYHEENEPDYRHAGIDLFVATEHQDQGIGTDAIRTVARYLIDQRGHHRLTIDPAVENVQAIRVYERLGFRRVGILREYWRSPAGDWRDGLLMDLLASELE